MTPAQRPRWPVHHVGGWISVSSHIAQHWQYPDECQWSKNHRGPMWIGINAPISCICFNFGGLPLGLVQVQRRPVLQNNKSARCIVLPHNIRTLISNLTIDVLLLSDKKAGRETRPWFRVTGFSNLAKQTPGAGRDQRNIAALLYESRATMHSTMWHVPGSHSIVLVSNEGRAVNKSLTKSKNKKTTKWWWKLNCGIDPRTQR